MVANSSIFLYITGGRTLWVPGHTPAQDENKPVHILNFASPRELSRSFYLFDMPIQLVSDQRTAAMIPGGKTPDDVITAVNEFRRVCTEDQDFLLKRCYDPNRPPAPEAPAPSPHPQLQLQLQQQQSLLSGGVGIGDAFAMRQNPPLNASGANLNQALLLQLLQQQQRAPIPQHVSPLQQPPPMTFNRGSLMGAAAGEAGGNMMMGGSGGMMSSPSPMGYNNNYYNPMMMMGRGNGLMPAPNAYPVAHPMGAGMSPLTGHNRGGNRGILSNGPFQAPMREKPEQLPNFPPIPPDILEIYMNPQQKLMCATMPGPRSTVWLRNHEIPTDTKNPRYVFCKGGIVLMLKTQGSEVANSKPVELFEQQVCAHFLIYGYCSRGNCLHRHHTEAQLRQLIARKYVELKSMTKKERHRLSERVFEKERENLARAAEDRGQRAKERMENAKRREVGTQESKTATGTGGGAVSPSAPASTPSVAHDRVGSVDKDENGGVSSDAQPESGNTTASHTAPPNGEKNSAGSVEKAPAAWGTAPFSSRRVLNPADIGVTDSEGGDGDDDDDDDSLLSSSSSSSSASTADGAKQPEDSKAETVKDEGEEVETTAPRTEEEQEQPLAEVAPEECTQQEMRVELESSHTEAVVAADVASATTTDGGSVAEAKEEENKEDVQEPPLSDVLEVTEGDEDKNNKTRKLRGKAAATKRARSPASKKAAAKGRKAKK